MGFRKILLCSLFVSTAAFAGQDYCKPYAMGESRSVMDQTLSGLFGGNTVSYLVTRNSKNDYTVSFNLEFWDHDPSDSKRIYENETEKKLRKRVAQCFQQASDAGLGDGQTRIRLHLVDESESGPRPGKVMINLNSERGFRSNSRNYSSDADCRTIVHEAFHLTGLLDEYYEPVIEKFLFFYRSNPGTRTPAFDCRARSSSLMGEGCFTVAWNKALRPAHIQAILFPKCGNDVYYSCLENAYETSERNGGGGCKQVSRECESPNEWQTGDLNLARLLD